MTKYLTTETVTSDICPITRKKCLHTRKIDWNATVGEGPFCAGHLYPNADYMAPRVVTSPRCKVIDDLIGAIAEKGQCGHRLIVKADVRNNRIEAWTSGLRGVPRTNLFTMTEGELVVINSEIVDPAISNLRRRKKI